MASDRKFDTECPGCGRALKLDAAALAASRACMYCGAQLRLDPEASLAADAAAAELKAAGTAQPAPARRFDCPICDKRVVSNAPAGAKERCFYCNCTFLIPEEGPLLPGGLVRRLTDAPPVQVPVDEMARRLGLAALDGSARLALEALAWRVLRGHEPADSGDRLAQAIAPALRSGPSAPPGACPAPPAWAADLAAFSLCPETPSTREEKDGAATLWLTTGKHVVAPAASGKSVGDSIKDKAVDALQDALAQQAGLAGLALGAVVGAAIPSESKDQAAAYEVFHRLRVDFAPAPEGCRYRFSKELSTGEIQELADRQKELARRIEEGLGPRVRPFACLKAVYGEWFDMAALRMLSAQRYSWWLGLLSPDLERAPGAAALLAQAKEILPAESPGAAHG